MYHGSDKINVWNTINMRLKKKIKNDLYEHKHTSQVFSHAHKLYFLTQGYL